MQKTALKYMRKRTFHYSAKHLFFDLNSKLLKFSGQNQFKTKKKNFHKQVLLYTQYASVTGRHFALALLNVATFLLRLK